MTNCGCNIRLFHREILRGLDRAFPAIPHPFAFRRTIKLCAEILYMLTLPQFRIQENPLCY